MQGGQWMGRTSGNIKIHGNDAVQVANYFTAAEKRTAGNRTAATGDDHLGRRDRLIGRR